MWIHFFLAELQPMLDRFWPFPTVYFQLSLFWKCSWGKAGSTWWPWVAWCGGSSLTLLQKQSWSLGVSAPVLLVVIINILNTIQSWTISLSSRQMFRESWSFQEQLWAYKWGLEAREQHIHHSSEFSGKSTVCEYFDPDLLHDFVLHICTSIILATKAEVFQIIMVLAMTSPTIARTCSCSRCLCTTHIYRIIQLFVFTVVSRSSPNLCQRCNIELNEELCFIFVSFHT